MSWYSEGAAAADALAASTQSRRKTKNFFTKPGESARIRFLSPATKSFNYKRAFVPWAKGQKLLTSPGTVPDPFVERGLQLQAAFAWLIIDRRKFEFETDEGETKSVGPRLIFFGDGQRTRKQLLAFEKEMLATENEQREEDGQKPLEIEEFNLTHYDIKASKDKGAPWNFVAMKPKALSKEDNELIEKYDFNLREELAPLGAAELAAILARPQEETSSKDEEDDTTTYSYSDEEDDTVKFD